MTNLALLLAVLAFADVQVKSEYQSPDLVGSEYLGDPYSMDFAADGRLYVLDRLQATVHHWEKDGTYLGRFGVEGEGPGELFYPVKVCAEKEGVWVWDFHRKFTKYSRKGEYLSSFKLATVEPKNFAVINDNKFLLGHRKVSDLKNIRFTFQLVDNKGNSLEQLLETKNEMYLKTPGGDGKEHVKGFGPQGDIQRDDQGHLYVGYSQNNLIYKLDENGKIEGKTQFKIPTGPATESEILMVKSMDVPAGSRRLALTDLIDFDFGNNKANYTHFLIKGQKIAFILTPIGGLGVLNAFHRATYFICDLKTGEVLSRGSYEYPVDSRVFHRNGRSLAVVSKDESYSIQEITLKGM